MNIGNMVSENPVVSLTLGFVGDICLGMGVRNLLQEHGPNFPLVNLAPVLADVDIAVGNLECCLVDDSCPPEACNQEMAVHTSLAAGLKMAGFRVLNLANNHVMDCGIPGLASTREYLESEGIAHFGAGNDVTEAEQPVVIEDRGRRIAFMGACDASRFHAGKQRPGIAPLRPRRLSQSVRELRAAADLVVVILHADLEFSQYPQPYRVRFSRSLIDQGASMVIQHHPHVFQGVEEYNGGLIAYSLGNCIFQVQGDSYMEKRPGTRDGFILKVHAEFDAVATKLRWECIPFIIGEDHRPYLPSGEKARDQLSHLNDISNALGNAAFLRRCWFERCLIEAKGHAYQIYDSVRHGECRKAIRHMLGIISRTEEHRWIYGLLSLGYV